MADSTDSRQPPFLTITKSIATGRVARWTHDGLVLSDPSGERYIIRRPPNRGRMTAAMTRAVDDAGWLWVRDGVVPKEAEAV